jgi:hypothetical protein
MSEFSVRDLCPGDILLFNSNNLFAKLIRLLDGTEVSHAALYVGNNQVAEALTDFSSSPGLGLNPISKTGCSWISVHRRLAIHQMQPVLKVAAEYVAGGNRYAYEQILLLAFICLTRKVELSNGLLRKIIVGAFDRANEMINQITARGREPMICSEFVFRVYDEAISDRNDPYSLEILSQGTGQPRRCFSRFRQRVHNSAATPEIDIPTVHPNSLLVRIQNKMGMNKQLTKNTVHAKIAEAQLEELIREYLDEPRVMKSSADTADTIVPEVSEEEVEAAAAEFTETLLSIRATDAKGQPLSGAEYVAAAPFSARVVATVADFVTPGDLNRSPSLTLVGRLAL